MLIERVKIEDFSWITLPSNNGITYKYLYAKVSLSNEATKKREIVELCIEPCLDGYDVALYGVDEGLLYPKFCTNSFPGDRELMAIEVANYLLKLRVLDKSFNKVYVQKHCIKEVKQ